MVKKNATTAKLRYQPYEKKGGRPPKSHKNFFGKNIYKMYAESKKLQSTQMRQREFYQKKRQLVLSARKTVFDRITLLDEQVSQQQALQSQASVSYSKFDRKKESKDEDMSDGDVEVHTVHMITEAQGDPTAEQEQLGPVTRSRRRAPDSQSMVREEGSSHVPHDAPKDYKGANPPNKDDEDEPAFGMDQNNILENREVEYKKMNENMMMLMDTVFQMQKQMAALMANRPEQVQKSNNPIPQPKETVQAVGPGETTSIPIQEHSVVMTREEIQQMVATELKNVKNSEIRVDSDKPYPCYHDLVPYLKGYNMPKLKQFSGIGNPDQHLAHFVTACGDTSAKLSLLLKQFSASLRGVAFEWYASLQPESIQNWQQMKDAFRVWVGGVSDKITIADLAATRQNKDEKVVEYIMRWRNLSIKCEQPLDQPQAVGLLLGNIDSWMAPFLSTSGITTFQELISQAKKLERTSPRVLSNFQTSKTNKPKKSEGVKYIATTFNVDKGKGTIEPHKQEQAMPPILGAPGNEPRSIPSLKERMNKKYSFQRDKVLKIFKDVVNGGRQLPECKRPEEQSKKDHPNYCPCHNVLGHTIEDCYVFKDWLERQYQEGKITLSKSVVLEQPAEHIRYVTIPDNEGSSQGEITVVGNKVMLPSIFDGKPPSVPEELWEVFISKKSKKMLKKLGKLPGIKWRNVEKPPEGLPIKQTKKKNKKKKQKREHSKHKKSIIEEYIDSLEEYEHKERVLITLKD
ncbi:Retrotransposon gag domain-containing protein [Dioscorea alata]|uniref:Retrotransposon gag domain-containing protein n=1 Tax=Dioscorea alata TaxID=55571 RepID=A0ACB7V1Q8_DIOAL|nr:Retrotransposon gag domain-containing protein [Dioscorea alata]